MSTTRQPASDMEQKPLPNEWPQHIRKDMETFLHMYPDATPDMIKRHAHAMDELTPDAEKSAQTPLPPLVTTAEQIAMEEYPIQDEFAGMSFAAYEQRAFTKGYTRGQQDRWIPVAMIHNDYDCSVRCSNCGDAGGFGVYDDLEWAKHCPGCGRPISEQVDAKGVRTPHPLYSPPNPEQRCGSEQ